MKGEGGPEDDDLYGKPLSFREIEVLVWYAKLASAKLVAHELGIVPQTVKNHYTSIFRKLGTHYMIETFYKLGWLRVPELPVQDLGEVIVDFRTPRNRKQKGFSPMVDGIDYDSSEQ